ncbi:hypothetical protein F0919_03500 [Taibaiella lutea]|uniref:Uncharacterized protein n=1 Tax=Taibaiella lutea TaxID=2608001 RepID=A0A5M6CNF2_9BACT|nr:hypothetical protein [Taibaiella lutea]KAA5536748.1 hypothetical protein F0919_03500 [Taibaiella lutea]
MPDNLSLSNINANTIDIDISGGGTSVTLPAADATANTAGLMSADDKAKIILQDGNAFSSDMNIGTKNSNTLNFKINNTTVGQFATSGNFYTNKIGFLQSGAGSPNSALITFASSGVTISRNVANSNTTLTVNQAHASSTGNTLTLQKAGSDQLSMNSTGILKVNNLAGTGTRMVTADSTGNLSASTEVTSGTYTPTTAITPTGTATPQGFTYMRVGNIVHVSGRLDCTGITGGISDVQVTLPIASTLNVATDVLGVVTGNGLSGASPNLVIGVPGAGNNYAQVKFFATSGSPAVYVQFQYQVI